MKKLIVVVLLICTGPLAYWYFRGDEATETGPMDETGAFVVKKGDLVITLTERGTLKTRNATRIRPQIRGNATIEWIIEEGTKVEKDQILVELDRTETKRRVEELEGRVIQLESEHKAAETELLIQEEQNKTDIEKADLAVEVADVTLKKLIEGDIPQEVRTRQIRINKAVSDVKRAQYKFDAMPELKEKGFITEDAYEQERISLETAKTEEESAKLDMKLYEDYQKPLDLKQKRSALTEATRNLERAKKQANARLEARRAVARQKDISLKSAQTQLAKQQDILSKMTLKAPTPGTVIYGDPDRPWQSEDVKVGAQVWSNLTLITLPDPSQLAVAFQVHEAEIDKVEVGMPALITSDTQKGTMYNGQISKIGAVANAGRRWGGDVKRFRVEVTFDHENVTLKSGTSATVELQIGRADSVLHVPVQAVHAREGEFFCYVNAPGGARRESVKLGRSNESFVEVVEGLEEGQQVLLYEPEPDQVESKKTPMGDSEDETS